MDEPERLAQLGALDLLDTAAEQEFDALTQLASVVCGTPIGLISLVDAERQWFKAAYGTSLKETHRSLSFCSHAIAGEGLFEVGDASQDTRFATNDLVTGDPRIRFYAGIPLHAPGGSSIGTLCVIDSVPRQLTEIQRNALTILGAQVEARLELRSKQKVIAQALEENRKLCGNLKASNDLFSAFMRHGPFASYIKDADGTMLFYNQVVADLGGVTTSDWLGLKDHEIWPAAMADAFRKNDIAVLESNKPTESEEVSPGPDNTQVVWKSLKFPYYDEARGRFLLAGVSFDITHEVGREAELHVALSEKTFLAQQLDASQHLLRSFLDHSPNQTYIKDETGRFVFYNREVQRFLGIDATAWIGRTIDEVRTPAEAARYIAQDQLVMATGEPFEEIDELVGYDGERRRFRSVKFSYKDISGKTMLAKISQDVTAELMRQEELAAANLQLELLATTDSLTGLSTRRVFDARAVMEFEVARSRQRPLSVIVLDVDDFKRRNDTFGHSSGDDALQMLATVLKSCVRSGDVAARLGGEEFALLLPECDPRLAMEIGHRIQSVLAEADHGPAKLTISIGVSSLDRTTANWERLLSRADDAMYEAKRRGKNRAIHHESLISDLLVRLTVPVLAT